MKKTFWIILAYLLGVGLSAKIFAHSTDGDALFDVAGPGEWTYFLSDHHPRDMPSFLAEYVAINNVSRKGLHFYRRMPDHLNANIPLGHLWHSAYSIGRLYSANEGTAFHNVVPVYVLEDMGALRAILEKEVGPDCYPIR